MTVDFEPELRFSSFDQPPRRKYTVSNTGMVLKMYNCIVLRKTLLTCVSLPIERWSHFLYSGARHTTSPSLLKWLKSHPLQVHDYPWRHKNGVRITFFYQWWLPNLMWIKNVKWSFYLLKKQFRLSYPWLGQIECDPHQCLRQSPPSRTVTWYDATTYINGLCVQKVSVLCESLCWQWWKVASVDLPTELRITCKITYVFGIFSWNCTVFINCY